MSTFETLSPYSNEVLGPYSYDSEQELNRKIDKISQKSKLRPVFERVDILFKLADLLEQERETLAQRITLEVGKTITESRVEVTRSVNTIKQAAAELMSAKGEIIDADVFGPARYKSAMAHKIPLGRVLCITPFNFPLNLAVHKIGPAFAMGNTIAFKPHPQNYQTGLMLVDLCHQAGMLERDIQFIFPEIQDLTKLIESDKIEAISFTGGTKTADSIARHAGRKKLCLELGGNDPLIIMDDADVEKAVEVAITHRFGSSGQRCTAAKRVFVHDQVYESFKEQLIEKTSKLVIGNPQDENVFMGPVANKEAADEVEKRIRLAIEDGAKLLLGNKRDNNIIYPTILENVNPNTLLVKDETFGPVISLFRFDQLDHVITAINSSNFGLQSGIFCKDIDKIKMVFESIEVGSLVVNEGPGFRAEQFPFGGVKDSGIGREGVKYAMEEFSTFKTLVF